MNLDALRVKPTLTGPSVRLVPLGARHAQAMFASTADDELRRLTGTHRQLTLEEIQDWCAGRAEQPDRLDLAIESPSGELLGEVALTSVDVHNASASVRIALFGKENLGRGIGRAALALLLDYAFGTVRLHRVWLEVFAFNERAIRAYRACGFEVEGRLRDALWWDGQWHDALLMAVLAP